MGVLAQHTGHLEKIQSVVKAVLDHFDGQKLNDRDIKDLQAAADLAYSDELLFEKFEMWLNEREDDVLFFHIRHYFDNRNKPVLSPEERDLSSRREEVETRIKEGVREKQKRNFAQRITMLAASRGLLTNEQLGEFLGVSAEQARKYKSGDNKPQLATLQQIASKFKIKVEELLF